MLSSYRDRSKLEHNHREKPCYNRKTLISMGATLRQMNTCGPISGFLHSHSPPYERWRFSPLHQRLLFFPASLVESKTQSLFTLVTKTLKQLPISWLAYNARAAVGMGRRACACAAAFLSMRIQLRKNHLEHNPAELVKWISEVHDEPRGCSPIISWSQISAYIWSVWLYVISLSNV